MELDKFEKLFKLAEPAIMKKATKFR